MIFLNSFKLKLSNITFKSSTKVILVVKVSIFHILALNTFMFDLHTFIIHVFTDVVAHYNYIILFSKFVR
jgi:hypothetical protein